MAEHLLGTSARPLTAHRLSPDCESRARVLVPCPRSQRQCWGTGHPPTGIRLSVLHFRLPSAAPSCRLPTTTSLSVFLGLGSVRPGWRLQLAHLTAGLQSPRVRPSLHRSPEWSSGFSGPSTGEAGWNAPGPEGLAGFLADAVAVCHRAVAFSSLCGWVCSSPYHLG